MYKKLCCTFTRAAEQIGTEVANHRLTLMHINTGAQKYSLICVCAGYCVISSNSLYSLFNDFLEMFPDKNYPLDY